METEEVVNKFLRDIVNIILGISTFTIKARQDAPRPTKAYADVSYISGFDIGWEQQSLINQTGEGESDLIETMSGQREKMFSIGFYRTGARDYAAQVRNSLVGSNIVQTFADAGIGLIRRSEIRDISEFFEKHKWEERAQFDIFLNIVGSSEDIIRSILSTEISGEVQSNSNQHNLNITI